MSFKLFRRGSARCIGILSAFVTILLCLYYICIGQPNSTHIAESQTLSLHLGRGPNSPAEALSSFNGSASPVLQFQHREPEPYTVDSWGDKCYVLLQSNTNITALEEHSKFDFQPEWMRSKEYWDRGFEERYEAQKKDKQRPPLKVIVVPHSHNDPGWLKTFFNYFQSDSRQILNLLVTKMQEYKDMTFIWSEISFLQLWWDQAHPTKQRALKRLVNSGRIEITTGGWVMTDEANVHIYPMLDQLIEGHQWLKNNLNITPKVGWSIDPFGHGSTVPYLLSGSNFEGAIIQRIHYAWKQWFARQQSGDFIWIPYWLSAKNQGRLLTHNMPFDIYSIKGSCGPHPSICLNFDFRKIPGEYTEYSLKAQYITDENVEEKAQLLLEQYARTASLFPHNVALIPVGDDFRYNKEREVDQQYHNYKKLISHITANKRLYNVDIAFGTPSDYFQAIRERMGADHAFPSFKGDFFVYSDIFSEGRPAYWSGYFTTRPFYKLLSSELEHNLRAAEILFTIAYNTARQSRHEDAIKIYEKNYELIIHARRNLGLFQHHDAITGTSKAAVMRDYAMRLFESTQNMVKMQEASMELLLQSHKSHEHGFLLSEFERDSFNKLPRKMPLQLIRNPTSDEAPTSNPTSAGKDGEASFVLYNALAQKRIEIVTLRVQQPNVRVLNEQGVELKSIQINPVWNISDAYEQGLSGLPPVDTGSTSTGRIHISTRQFEVMFVAELEPLSLTTYRVQVDEFNYKRNIAIVYCDDCATKMNSDHAPGPTAPPAPDKAIQFEIRAKPAGM
ncbi:alpha-mannosidase 2 isoform X2 [Drosophila busckii]|uniref:alpha-mannosidase 2 isoform X2 n=1 Tax=Drosophila busckii TaxID=30019 RepID=UPI00083EE36D|nr:alpha-mannosidase 2 isoform X2 [Drosophila busckii]